MRAIEGSYGDKGSLLPHESPVLNMSWQEFAQRVQHDQYNSFQQRLGIIREARNLFEIHKIFNNIPINARKRFAGFGRDDPNVDWGWFGGMRALGVFMQRVNRGDQHLSDALDHIPLHGPINRDQYIAYIQEYRAAFAEAPRVPGISAGSRLLAMNRPDYFLCLTARNESALFAEFGIRVRRDDFGGYWDSVVDRVINAIWWDTPRPVRQPDEIIWDARAAFLDSLYYEEG